MKKSLLLASLLGASTMMAADVQYFVGAGAINTKIDVKGSYNYSIGGQTESASGTESFKDTGLLLKAGAILDNNRFSLAYNNFSKDETDADVVTLNYDYLFDVADKFKLYAGAHLGNASVEFADVLDMSGLVYGAQIGSIYEVTENVELEVGFSYSKYNVDKSASITNGADFLNANIELDKSTSLFATINYKF